MQNNWEVEQKYSVHDRRSLEATLQQAGYVEQRSETHCDVYFRHPCRDFRDTDEAFRLRSVDEGACVTYKGKRLAGPTKTRQEIELSIAADEQRGWQEVLQALGFQPLPAVHKRRRVFVHSSASLSCSSATEPVSGEAAPLVLLDEVQQLGTFAEIELVVAQTPAQPPALLAARQRIEQLAQQLGLQDVQPRSYLSLLLQRLGVE